MIRCRCQGNAGQRYTGAAPIAPLPIKKALRQLLDQCNFDQIAQMAVRKKRVLGSLVSLTFDSDRQIAWRAIEAMGLAADRLAQHNAQFVRNHLRKLYWLISEESGGICWHAPEAMAEILHHRSELFDDYIPIVVLLLREMADEDLDHFRPGVLWAIGRLGSLAEKHVEGVLAQITAALDDSNLQVRGMAVWALGQVGKVDLLTERPELLSDPGLVDFYEAGQLTQTTVGRLVQRATDSGSQA